MNALKCLLLSVVAIPACVPDQDPAPEILTAVPCEEQPLPYDLEAIAE